MDAVAVDVHRLAEMMAGGGGALDGGSEHSAQQLLASVIGTGGMHGGAGYGQPGAADLQAQGLLGDEAGDDAAGAGASVFPGLGDAAAGWPASMMSLDALTGPDALGAITNSLLGLGDLGAALGGAAALLSALGPPLPLDMPLPVDVDTTTAAAPHAAPHHALAHHAPLLLPRDPPPAPPLAAASATAAHPHLHAHLHDHDQTDPPHAPPLAAPTPMPAAAAHAHTHGQPCAPKHLPPPRCVPRELEHDPEATEDDEATEDEAPPPPPPLTGASTAPAASASSAAPAAVPAAAPAAAPGPLPPVSPASTTAAAGIKRGPVGAASPESEPRNKVPRRGRGDAAPAELRSLFQTSVHDTNPRAHQQAQDRAALAAVLGDDARSPRGTDGYSQVHPGTLRVPTMPRSASSGGGSGNIGWVGPSAAAVAVLSATAAAVGGPGTGMGVGNGAGLGVRGTGGGAGVASHAPAMAPPPPLHPMLRQSQAQGHGQQQGQQQQGRQHPGQQQQGQGQQSGQQLGQQQHPMQQHGQQQQGQQQHPMLHPKQQQPMHPMQQHQQQHPTQLHPMQQQHPMQHPMQQLHPMQQQQQLHPMQYQLHQTFRPLVPLEVPLVAPEDPRDARADGASGARRAPLPAAAIDAALVSWPPPLVQALTWEAISREFAHPVLAAASGNDFFAFDGVAGGGGSETEDDGEVDEAVRCARQVQRELLLQQHRQAADEACAAIEAAVLAERERHAREQLRCAGRGPTTLSSFASAPAGGSGTPGAGAGGHPFGVGAMHSTPGGHGGYSGVFGNGVGGMGLGLGGSYPSPSAYAPYADSGYPSPSGTLELFPSAPLQAGGGLGIGGMHGGLGSLGIGGLGGIGGPLGLGMAGSGQLCGGLGLGGGGTYGGGGSIGLGGLGGGGGFGGGLFGAASVAGCSTSAFGMGGGGMHSSGMLSSSMSAGMQPLLPMHMQLHQLHMQPMGGMMHVLPAGAPGYLAAAIPCVPPPGCSSTGRDAAPPPVCVFAAAPRQAPEMSVPMPMLTAVRSPVSRLAPVTYCQQREQRPLLGCELVEPCGPSKEDRLPVVCFASRYRPLHRRLYADVSIICRTVPDAAPGDDLLSALRWLRCAAAGASGDPGLIDVPLHTSREVRARGAAQRARRLTQTHALHADDPLRSPSLMPGKRPPDASERLAAQLARQALIQRKSEREKVAPRQVYDPSAYLSQSGGGPGARKPGGPIAPRLLLGPEFQTVCPRVEDLPSGPTAEERLVLGSLVHAAGMDDATATVCPQPPFWSPGNASSSGPSERGGGGGGRKGKAGPTFPAPTHTMQAKQRKRLTSERDLHQRHYLMDDTVKELDKKLGGLCKVMGVSSMGSKIKALWVDKDEVAFAAGVRRHDREFELIQRDFLPHKTMSQLICYYYNIWKIRYTKAAAVWHVERKARKEAEALAKAAGTEVEVPEPPSSEPEEEPESS
ncbi:hypothetical protein FOA52_003854 [Chlamydomonas sp. UWO 241]|nr:hypothetical protein FOA52_003854 [Chlamydomonas sp. UWO 241]